MSKAINIVKDGYLAVIAWVDDHPHAALWITLALLVAVLVLR